MRDIFIHVDVNELGEVVTVPKNTSLLKVGSTYYEQFIGSRYVCIRKAGNGQSGILLKVVGMTGGESVKIVKDQAFVTDYEDVLFSKPRYYGYPVPSAEEVRTVLDIIRGNEALLQQLASIGMHIDPGGTFWVNDLRHRLLLRSKLQYLSGIDGRLYDVEEGQSHTRITLVYFENDELFW